LLHRAANSTQEGEATRFGQVVASANRKTPRGIISRRCVFA
jgi:hypothetical protein